MCQVIYSISGQYFQKTGFNLFQSRAFPIQGRFRNNKKVTLLICYFRVSNSDVVDMSYLQTHWVRTYSPTITIILSQSLHIRDPWPNWQHKPRPVGNMVSEGHFIYHFASLLLEGTWVNQPTLYTNMALKQQHFSLHISVLLLRSLGRGYASYAWIYRYSLTHPSYILCSFQC